MGEYAKLLDPFSDLPESAAEFVHPERGLCFIKLLIHTIPSFFCICSRETPLVSG